MEVGQEILSLYSLLPENGKPQNNKQYTILAGIVAYAPSIGFFPLCLCTGTKCLGNSDPNYVPGSTLSDSHAEVLARRSLLRYFILSLIEILKNPNYEIDDRCPFRKDAGGMFHLKSEWTLWMYISDSPCGEASIYQRLSIERCFTGKKSRNVEPLPNPDGDGQHLSMLLRCKPGRIDIQDSRRSSSMSCSDKICRWSCLGLQGALLSKFVSSPIFLSGIVISKDLASKEEDGQETAIRRAITDRLSICSNSAHSPVFPTIPNILFTTLQYENGKCYLENQQYVQSISLDNPSSSNSEVQTSDLDCSKRKRKAKALLLLNPCSDLKSCSTNINWIRNVGSVPDGKVKSQCQGGTIEITLANTGRPQGTTKATASKAIHSNESRLCRRALGRLCLELESLCQGDAKRGTTEPILYSDYKRTGNEKYLQTRDNFLKSEAFRNWAIDDPEVSDMFTLTDPISIEESK